jgi:hypothetical protein
MPFLSYFRLLLSFRNFFNLSTCLYCNSISLTIIFLCLFRILSFSFIFSTCLYCPPSSLSSFTCAIHSCSFSLSTICFLPTFSISLLCVNFSVYTSCPYLSPLSQSLFSCALFLFLSPCSTDLLQSISLSQ